MSQALSNADTVPSQTSQSSRAPIFRAAWVVMAVFILSNATTPLYSHWQHLMGFGSGTLATIFAAYIAGLICTLLVAGQLSDHFGRKVILVPGVMLAMMAAMLFEIADTVIVLVLARVLAGISVGIIVSAGMANVVDRAGEAHKRLASLMASVAMVLGAGAGPFIAGLLSKYTAYPVRNVFGVELGLLFIALLMVLCQPSQRPGEMTFHFSLPSVPRNNLSSVGFGILFFGPGITATSFVLSLGPSLFSSFLHVDSPLVAGSTAFTMFMVAVGIQFAAQKYSTRTVFILSGSLTLFSMITLWISVHETSALWLMASALLAGAGQGTGQLGGLTLIGMEVPTSHRAQANSLFNMGGYLPAGLLPVMTGYLIDLIGIQTGVAVLAGLIMTAAVAAVAFVIRQPVSRPRA
ncbi:MFS transporter [Kushneria sp. Sum13]|uniref:MFS transporter n=1 Tax=Kushneria sp. Sum13 TaxID=3459196 RepID=UPI004045A176